MSLAEAKLQQFLEPTVEMLLDEAVGSEQFSKEPLLVPYIPTSAPKDFYLGSVRDARLRVVSPLHVNLADEDGSIRAEATEIDEFGFGETYAEALSDLQRAIAELFFSLEEARDRLGADLERVWRVLQEKVRRL
jgi:hypothetical protein